MRPTFILSFLLMNLAPAYAGSIKTICSLSEAEKPVIRKVEQVTDILCGMQANATSPEIRTLIHDTLNVISRLKKVYPEERRDEILDESEFLYSLKRVAQTFQPASAPNPTFSNTLIGKKLQELNAHFGNSAQRFSNPKAYVDRMLEVLSLSKEGKRVVDCFYKKENKAILGSTFKFSNLEESAGPNGAAHANYALVGKDDGYLKQIFLDPGPDPAMTLIILAHELQHSCNTEEFLASMQRLKANGYSDEGAAKDNIDLALDEMRAFSVMPKIFSDIAKESPAFMCNGRSLNTIFGPQIMSSGEFFSTLEVQLKENKFFDTLVDSYSRIFHSIDPDTLYVKDSAGNFVKDSSGKKVLVPELERRLKNLSN